MPFSIFTFASTSAKLTYTSHASLNRTPEWAANGNIVNKCDAEGSEFPSREMRGLTVNAVGSVEGTGMEALEDPPGPTHTSP